jgi:hypothetical protein
MRTTSKNRNALTRARESEVSKLNTFSTPTQVIPVKVSILVNNRSIRHKESVPLPKAVRGLLIDYSEPLEINYATNYDIRKVDNYIKEYFMVQNYKLPDIRDRIKMLETKMEEQISISEDRKLQREITELMTSVKRIESGHSYLDYYANTNQLVKKYENTIRDDDMFSDKRCEKIVDSFLRIASKYLPLHIKKELPSKNECLCVNCGECLSGVKQSITGHKVCMYCKHDNFVLKHLNVVKEYDTWGNFLKAFNRYTGVAYLNASAVKFNINELMRTIDDYSEKQGKPLGEYYRKQPLNSTGKKDGTSHEFICKALCILKYKDFYKDYMYICHHYYGWKYPDVKHLLGEIEINFKIKQEVWKKMTDLEKGGQSSLPTQYRLYREFQHVGIKCQAGDFRLAEKIETITRHDRVYSIMCKRGNIPFPHIVSGGESGTEGSEGSESSGEGSEGSASGRGSGSESGSES